MPFFLNLESKLNVKISDGDDNEEDDDNNDINDDVISIQVLSFTDEETWRLFKIMASILHLGNISFRGNHSIITHHAYT